MQLSGNNPRKDFVPDGNRLPLGLVWLVVWLTCFGVSCFLGILLQALHIPQHEVQTYSPDPVLLAMPLVGLAFLLTFSIWRHRQTPQGSFKPRMLLPPVFLLGIALLNNPGAQPDWLLVCLCMAGLYFTFSFLTWWIRTQISPTEDLADAFTIGTPDPLSPLLFSGSHSAVSLQAIEGLYLIKDTGQELTFRIPTEARFGLLFLSMICGCFFYFIIDVFHNVRYFSPQLIIPLAGLYFMGFGTFATLSRSGPNTLVLNLQSRTYTHTTYAPLPIRKYARLGYGIPFWVQTVTGPMSDMAGVCVREIATKNGPLYWLHLTWKNPCRLYGFLGRSYHAEEARSQMLALAERIGVPDLGRCID